MSPGPVVKGHRADRHEPPARSISRRAARSPLHPQGRRSETPDPDLAVVPSSPEPVQAPILPGTGPHPIGLATPGRCPGVSQQELTA